MSLKIRLSLIGALVGVLALGLCTQNVIWAIVGAVVGGLVGLVFAVTQAQMAKDRETGLDG